MATSAYIPLFELASGGMGAVTLGIRINKGFERLYAIKRLRGSGADDEEIRRMFVEEARVAGLLRHPNVVSVLDAGEDEDGPFLVMEWIDGVPLHELFRAAASEGPTPIGLMCELMAQVAGGLHAAHELRTHAGEALALVHRDVSPSNILVGFDGLARVTDFGIAKAMGGKKTTGHGVLKGKFGYMSPEQLRFDEIDRRSDLFALGVVLFEMVAGRRLYPTADGIEQTARRILREPAPAIRDERRDAPMELEELLYELLAKVPRARPKTAQEVAQRLNTIARDLEDSPPLGAYLQERFGERRQAMAERIAQRIQKVSKPRLAASPRRRGRVAAAALTLALGGGALLWLNRDVVTSTEVPTPAASAPTRSALPARSEANEPVPMNAEVVTPPPEPEVTEAAMTEPSPMARRRRRRSMRPRATMERGERRRIEAAFAN